jgi:hypothetical protein
MPVKLPVVFGDADALDQCEPMFWVVPVHHSPYALQIEY